MEFKIGSRVKWRPWGNKNYPVYRGVVVGMFIKDVLPDGSHEIGYEVRVKGRKKKPPTAHLQRDDWYRRVIYRLTLPFIAYFHRRHVTRLIKSWHKESSTPSNSMGLEARVVAPVSTGSSTKSVAVTPDE